MKKSWKHLSKRALSTRLAELSNVSLQTIKDTEHTKRSCQVDTLVAIASALHLSPDYLLGFTKY